jgi:hypothetical protein
VPFSSSQISEMIGGQQVMFANNAAFAHQVGAVAGISPPQGANTSLSSPSFGRSGYSGQDLYFTDKNSPGGYGASLIGGVGGAVPGIASGLSIAGGMGWLGKAGSYMDPFTGAGRAFATGAGAAGEGMIGTVGAVGRSFANTGMAGGMAALGGGLSAAATAALPYYAMGKAIDTFGQNIYAGAQNISQVGAMANQYFTPQYGESGARPGGTMARGQIKQITETLHEIVGEETMTSMVSLKRMMDQAGQMGMLSGIQNADQFKLKFKQLVTQAKEVAKIVGSSLEEAMPMLGQFQQMGMWTPRDVMGAAAAMKVVGPQAQGALMGSMQSGAQRSYAMGGSMASGAFLGRQSFLNVQAAVGSGVISPEAIQELTGGVGGVEGQQMVADRLASALQNTAYTPVGRLSMAAMGEVKDGRFTGRADQKKINEFIRGGGNLNSLQKMGMNNAYTRDGAASFTYRQDQLGQDMMAKGGVELMAGMFQVGLDRAGFGGSSEDIQGLMLQKMFGLQTRDAHFIQKMMKELPTIREKNTRRQMDALRDAFQQAEEKQNRSWEGLKIAMARSFELGVEDPIQHLAEGLTTGANEQIDRFTDWVWGRKRQMNISGGERLRILSRGGFAAAPENLQRSMMSGSFTQRYENPLIERIGNAAQGGMFGFGRAEALAGLGGRTRTGSIGDGGGSEAEIQVSGGLVMSVREAEEAVRRAELRANPSRKLAQTYKLNADTQAALGTVTEVYKKLAFNPATARRLSQAKSEEEKQKILHKMITEDPEGQRALQTLYANRHEGDTKSRPQSAYDAIALAQSKAGATDIEVDFRKIADRHSPYALARDPKQLSAFADSAAEEAYDALRTVSGAHSGWGPGVTLNSESGTPSHYQDLGVSAQELRDFLGTEAGAQFTQYVQSGATGAVPERGYEALRGELRSNKTAKTIFSRLGSMTGLQKDRLAENLQKLTLAKQIKVTADVARDRATLAKQELENGGLTGLSDSAAAKYKAILEKFKTADIADSEAGTALTRDLASSLSAEDLRVFRGASGAVARNIAEVGSVERLDGSGMTKGQFSKQLRDSGLSQAYASLGVVDKATAASIEGYFGKDSAGGSKLTSVEFSKIKDELRKVTGRGGPTEGAGREDLQDKLTNTLTKFADASTRFVLAVASATPGLDNAAVQDLRERISALKGATGKPGAE